MMLSERFKTTSRIRRRPESLPRTFLFSLFTACLLFTSFFLNSLFLYRVSNERHYPAHDLYLSRQNNKIINKSINNHTEDLLQFAIIGFGKCGTTSVLKWLQKHPEIAVLPVENFDLMHHQPDQLIEKLTQLPSNKLKGYKSPVDVTLPHLIVGVRHPVHWFASLYNFRLQQQRSPFLRTTLPPPDELIGACVASARNTCTYKGEFALFLRQLGKTKQPHIVSEFERRMYRGAHLEPPNTTTITDQSTMVVSNPFFLYEIRELEDHPDLVSQALTDFLGLSTPLSAEIPILNQQKRPSSLTDSTTSGKMRMDICEHRRVRFELMRIARSSSVWIRNYFLAAPDSSHIVTLPHFSSYVKDWMMDPCKNQQEETQSAGRYILQAFRDEQELANKH